MRNGFASLVIPALLMSCLSASAQSASSGTPTNPKAQKTYAEAQDKTRHLSSQDRLDRYRKADKQDNHQCYDCALQAAKLALKLGQNDLAREEAVEMEALAKTAAQRSDGYLFEGVALLNAGMMKHNDRTFADADSILRKASAMNGSSPYALYEDGVALAYLHHDDAARAQFQAFCDATAENTVDKTRAQRYIARPELARERMAPAFALTTMDGRRIALDSLQGKVVLLDFWATWCGPCREALPRIQNLAKKFDGEPLVVLSISLDSDDAKWRSFVESHHMTWPQYRDGSAGGQMAQIFGIHAIPATFTIDADGVLEDQHVGDANIEGKLKKLIAQAQQAKALAATGN